MRNTRANSKGATKRFMRRLFLTFVIALVMVAGAIVIAYCKGSEKGQQLYQQQQVDALTEAYQQGYADARTATIEAGCISRFALEGEDFIVYLSFNGEEHDYHCQAGNVVEALPFQ